jgi:hypothetical protein
MHEPRWLPMGAGSPVRRLSKYGGVALSLAVILVASACGSGSPGSGSETSAPPSPQPSVSSLFLPDLAVTSPGTPVDIPSGAPTCPANTPTPLSVSSSVTNLVSACGGYYSESATYVALFTNLSAAVLDVNPGANATNSTVDSPSTDFGLVYFTWDDAEVYAQTEAFRELTPPAGEVLVPVGGTILVTASSPISITVAADSAATAESRAADLLIDYVVDNLKEEVSGKNIFSYTESVASCVNDAYSLWGSLNQDQADDSANTISKALTSYSQCQDLQEKLKDDSASDLHAVALPTSPNPAELDPDLSRVASDADQDDWVSTLGDLLEDGGKIAENLHG